MKTSNFCRRNYLKFILFCCSLLLLISCNVQDELANNSPPDTDPFDLDTGDDRDSSDAPGDTDDGRDATPSSDAIEGDASPDTPGDDVQTCAPSCDHGEECLEHQDCISQVCDEGLCQEPTCYDGVKNGDETGTDCGGQDCEPCDHGEECLEHQDCISQVCVEGLCQEPTCFDGVKNGDETGTDCGGPDCEPCDHGEECLEHQDCISQVCVEGLCQEPTCYDGVKNGDETGTDCGGPDCAPCSAGQACQADSDCGETRRSNWDSCQFSADICAEEGTQTRQVTYNECVDNICTPRQDTDTQTCSRNTSNQSCGTTDYSSWSSCSGFEGTCGQDGTKTRTKTTYSCESGTCEPTTTTQTESCTRNTNGNSCGSVQYSSWSSCAGFEGTCGQDGTKTRTKTTYSCESGTCEPTTTTQTESCTRTTNGNSCGSVQYGSWSSCSGFEGTCGQDGTKTRTKTTYSCASGSCSSTTTTQTESCTRNTNGNSCGQGVVKGNWSSCEYGSTCSNSGTRTRPITTYSCSGGSCSSISQLEQDSCSRDTNGTSCDLGAHHQCTNWSQCQATGDSSCSGTQQRTCLQNICSSGTCSKSEKIETRACAASDCTCGVQTGTCDSHGVCSCVPTDECTKDADCGIGEECCLGLQTNPNYCQPKSTPPNCLAPYL